MLAAGFEQPLRFTEQLLRQADPAGDILIDVDSRPFGEWRTHL
jgi:hypothetical protein